MGSRLGNKFGRHRCLKYIRWRQFYFKCQFSLSELSRSSSDAHSCSFAIAYRQIVCQVHDVETCILFPNVVQLGHFFLCQKLQLTILEASRFICGINEIFTLLENSVVYQPSRWSTRLSSFFLSTSILTTKPRGPISQDRLPRTRIWTLKSSSPLTFRMFFLIRITRLRLMG